MAIEYELKFQATPERQQAVLAAVAGQECEYSMQTVYYDTPDGALSAKKYTLRKRRENDTYVCTLKTPEKGNGRGEWELPCREIGDALSPLVALGAPEELLQLTQGGVQEICGAKFKRLTMSEVLEEGILELEYDLADLTEAGIEMLPRPVQSAKA